MGSALDRAAERWGQAWVLDGGEETTLGGSPLVEAESWGCGATRVPGAAPSYTDYSVTFNGKPLPLNWSAPDGLA